MPDSVISHTWTIAAHRVLVLPDPDRRPAHLGEAAVGVRSRSGLRASLRIKYQELAFGLVRVPSTRARRGLARIGTRFSGSRTKSSRSPAWIRGADARKGIGLWDERTFAEMAVAAVPLRVRLAGTRRRSGQLARRY
jgi:hypothetical protein